MLPLYNLGLTDAQVKGINASDWDVSTIITYHKYSPMFDVCGH